MSEHALTDQQFARLQMPHLGTANGWMQTPPLVELCGLRGHDYGSGKWRARRGGGERFTIGCDVCGYRFDVDEGDCG